MKRIVAFKTICGKDLFLLTLISNFFFNSCAQSIHGIKEARAFYQQQFTGTVAVDDNGNQITPGTDTARWIYVETKGKEMPSIDTVSFYGSLYTTSISLVENRSVILGTKKNTNEEVKLEPASGNEIWKIELTRTGIIRDPNDNRIKISGERNGKRYWLNVETVVEMEAELRN